MAELERPVGPDPPDAGPTDGDRPRRRYELAETGFDEVPRRYRKYYRKWLGPADALALNEVVCPICKVVIRSPRELRPGDRLYCMCCFARMTVRRAASGELEAEVLY